jgi:branched-chain amino acid transport system substrate-binding protein
MTYRASIRRFALGLMLAFTGAVCAPVAANAQQSPFEINVLLSLTGTFANLGNTERRTLEAMEPAINKQGGIKGQPIHFTVYDDQSNPQTGLQLATQLIAKHAQAILGSDVGGICSAITPLLTSGPVLFCISPTIQPKSGSFVFVNGIDNTNQALGMVQFFNRRGWKRLAVITPIDSTGQGLDQHLADVMASKEAAGMTLVSTEHYNPTDINVDAVMSRVKAANPQAIVLWAVGGAFGTAIHSLQNVGLDVPVGTTSGNAGIDGLKQFAAFMPKDMFVVGSAYLAPSPSDPPAVKEQVQAFFDAMKPTGVTIDYLTGTAWDPAMILITAWRKLGTNATAEQIRTFIESQSAYPGIAGIHNFTDGSQRGLNVSSVLITRWNSKTASFSAAEGEKVK